MERAEEPPSLHSFSSLEGLYKYSEPQNSSVAAPVNDTFYADVFPGVVV